MGANVRRIAIAGALAIVATSSVAADMTLSPSEYRTLQTLITGAGYQCPEAKIANSRGLQPGGLMIRVYCGPPGGNGVIESLVYQVFLDPNSGSPKAVKPGKGP